MSEFTESDFVPTVSAEDEAWLVAQLHPDAAPQAASFLAAVQRQADHFRRDPDPVSQFLADQLANIAQLVIWTDARNPDEYIERLEIAEDEARARFYDRGWHDGSEATKAELAPYRRPE
jgi:hypothetical protein